MSVRMYYPTVTVARHDSVARLRLNHSTGQTNRSMLVYGTTHFMNGTVMDINS